MHPLLVFLHVLLVLGFLVAHGASIHAAFTLRRERQLERVRALLELSHTSYKVMYPSLYGLLITGIIAGFTYRGGGGAWSQGWIWLSLILLIAISVAMMILGGPIYSGGARRLVGLPYMERGKTLPAIEPGSAEELDAQLSKGNPMLLTAIGFGGIAVIAWLMMFKPF